MKNFDRLISDISARLREEGGNGPDYTGLRCLAEDFLSTIFSALFPRHFCVKRKEGDPLSAAAQTLYEALLFFVDEGEAARMVTALFEALPTIKRRIETDIEAAYRGDPAAKSHDEIPLCYPAFTAIATYRIAHRLYELKVPTLPRMLSELAHERTGIDIHPGATIGNHFFIDHGTGVVIGETTTIGEHVTLYQHVTLGAKNFEALPDGSLVKGIKRHPDIGNHVVIYAGATILGGNTVIGDGCTIGGNVWLTHSLPSGTTIVAKPSSEIRGDV